MSSSPIDRIQYAYKPHEEQLFLPGQGGICVICGKPLQNKRAGRCCSGRCRMIRKRRIDAREKELKRQGLKAAAKSHGYELGICRQVARRIAITYGTVDMERVREELEELGVEFVYGNWCGQVFAGEEWEPTGEFVAVRHKGGRRRGGGVRVWRLRQR